MCLGLDLDKSVNTDIVYYGEIFKSQAKVYRNQDGKRWMKGGQMECKSVVVFSRIIF